MADKRILELNDLQDRLYKRLQAVENRIKALEKPGAVETPRGDPLLEKNRKIGQAAWELEDAIFDRDLPRNDEKNAKTQYPKEISVARKHHVELLRANNWYNKAIVCLVILTFVEVPPWCHEKHGSHMNHWEFKAGSEWCPLPAYCKPDAPNCDANPNLSGVSYLPPGWAFIAEVFIEAVILYKFWCEHTLERDHFWPMGQKNRKKLTHFGILFAVGSIIDTAIFLIYRNPFRLTFIFRTGLIFLLPGVQHIFTKIFNRTVMTEFGSVAVFFLGTMVFFAWIAFTVFQSNNTFSYMEGEEIVKANKGFTSFPEAINTMFVGGVTGEFVDSFLPSFNACRLSGAVWMVYLLLTQVLFKNLVMDTLISAYLKGKEKEDREVIEAQVRGMTAAFDLLAEGRDDEKEIEKEDFLKFVEVLRSSPRWKPMPEKAASMFFDQFGRLTKENFLSMCCLLQSEFWITDRYSACAPKDQHIKDESGDPAVVNSYLNVWSPGDDANGDPISSNFDWFMNQVLLCNLVMVLIESAYDLQDLDEPPITDLIEIAFSCAYVGEVVVKLKTKSWLEYWSYFANKFDFFTTWLLCFTSIVKYLPFAGLRGDLARYANILRLLRLIRILKQLKSFKQVQFMIAVISRIVTCAGEVLQLMGTFFFFFCNLSLNLFGGLLHQGNEALEESEYAEKHWYVLNFNDMFMAFQSWFVQVLCEYVPNYSDALTRAATAKGLSYGPYSGLIVLLFYITTAAIMYELLLAFTVDVFMDVKKEQGNKKESEVEEEEEEEENEEEEAKENQKTEEGEEESSSSSSSSESEFEPEDFVEELQKDKFDPAEQVLHFNCKFDVEFQEELLEKYEKILNSEKGKEADEESFEAQITKAAWTLENGVCHDPIRDEEAYEKKEALEKEKDAILARANPEEDSRKKEIKEEIRKVDKQMEQFPTNLAKARDDHITVQKAVKWFHRAIAVLVFLTLTEVPAWCHADKAEHLTIYSFVPGTDWCRPPEKDADMYLSGIWYMPPGIAVVFEIIAELLILRRFWLEWTFEKEHFATLGNGQIKYSNLDNVKVGVVCAVCSIIDTVIFAIFHMPYRFTWVFRTGLLSLLPGFQRLRIRIFNWRMIGQFTSVAVFFIGTVLFYAWIFVTIYKDNDAFAFTLKEEEVKVNRGFEGLRASIYTTFLAGMTEGFSDIFIPTITSNRAAAILWIIFLLLTQVLFLNLVIDAFVAAYLESSEDQMDVQAQAEAKALFHASQLLFAGEEIEKDVFLDFISEVSRSPRMKPVSRELAEAIYDQFKEKEEGVNRENFVDVCSLVAKNPMWIAPRNSFLEMSAPGVWNSGWFESVRAMTWPKIKGEDSYFDWVMDWVLIFNMFFIVVQSLPDKDKKYLQPPAFLHLSTFFTLIYVFEVGVKLAVKSWKTYWSDKSNQFDFYTTWLLFGAWSLQFIHIQELQRDLMRYANILRLLRLLRVAKKLKKYRRVQFMVTTVVTMLEGAADIMTLLGVCLFFFTTFSVNFFGGLLYEGNAKLVGSEYEEKHWFVFNFNDCIMGYATWFVQLLCEYAPEWAEALYRTSSIGWISWYIYPSFYLIGVAIVFEILKAFTIETYLALKEVHDDTELKRKKKEKRKKEEEVREEAEEQEGGPVQKCLEFFFPAEEEDLESEPEEDSEDEKELLCAFEKEDEHIKAVTELLKKDKLSLHTRRALLPKLQVAIKKAWEEHNREEEKEARKQSKEE